jgi:hypothetical protein
MLPGKIMASKSDAYWDLLNLFPNLTPGLIYRWLRPIEPVIESSRFWNALCTVDMYGLIRAETR